MLLRVACWRVMIALLSGAAPGLLGGAVGEMSAAIAAASYRA